MANGYRVDFSHKIRHLKFSDDESESMEAKRNDMNPQNVALDGTTALHPMIFGNMEIGFYSAYFLDVNLIIGKENGQIFLKDYAYTATH